MKKLLAGFLFLSAMLVVSCGTNCPSGQTNVNGVCQYAGYPGTGYPGSYPYNNGTPYYPGGSYYPSGNYYAPQGYGYPQTPYPYQGGSQYPCPMGSPYCMRAN